MASGEDRRAQLMAKARRNGDLSWAEQAQLTSGQLAKLRSEGKLRSSTAGQWVDPGNPFGVSTPGGPPAPPSNNGDTDGGDTKKTRPAFTNGYDPDEIYTKAMQALAAKRDQYFDPIKGRYATGERELANEYGLGINQDGSGASFTGQWAASDPTRLGIDPSNPFSRASLLNKSYFVSGKVGEGSYANRGLLSSGAYQRSMDRDNFRFTGGKTDLIRSFGKQLMDYRQQRQDMAAQLAAEETAQRNALFDRRRDIYDRENPI